MAYRRVPRQARGVAPSEEIDALLRDAARYEPTTVAHARQLCEPLIWHNENGATLRAEVGDWELADDDGKRWTVAPDSFSRTYRRLPDGRYVKHEPVDAVRLRAPLAVPTREGSSTAEPGDWLLRDAEGALWPVPDEVFRARYRPAAPRRLPE